MNENDNTRKIAETVVGAAIGAVIAGPIGAVAGGLLGSQTAEHTRHLGDAMSAVETPPFHGPLQRILVPLDFSKDSEKALIYAASLARKFGAKTSLLHVLPPAFFAGEMGVVPDVVPPAESVETCRDRLGNIGKNLAVSELVENLIVRDGTPFEQICGVARESEIDMIVIATHGVTGLRQLFLGSTTEKVTRHAPCPVLVVRERERDFV